MSKKVEVKFGRKELTIPNRVKVLSPEVIFTRGEVIVDDTHIAPLKLPHAKIGRSSSDLRGQRFSDLEIRFGVNPVGRFSYVGRAVFSLT